MDKKRLLKKADILAKKLAGSNEIGNEDERLPEVDNVEGDETKDL